MKRSMASPNFIVVPVRFRPDIFTQGIPLTVSERVKLTLQPFEAMVGS